MRRLSAFIPFVQLVPAMLDLHGHSFPCTAASSLKRFFQKILCSNCSVLDWNSVYISDSLNWNAAEWFVIWLMILSFHTRVLLKVLTYKFPCRILETKAGVKFFLSLFNWFIVWHCSCCCLPWFWQFKIHVHCWLSVYSVVSCCSAFIVWSSDPEAPAPRLFASSIQASLTT